MLLTVTTTFPVVAPVGTVAAMLVEVQLDVLAVVPLNVTIPEERTGFVKSVRFSLPLYLSLNDGEGCPEKYRSKITSSGIEVELLIICPKLCSSISRHRRLTFVARRREYDPMVSSVNSVEVVSERPTQQQGSPVDCY